MGSVKLNNKNFPYEMTVQTVVEFMSENSIKLSQIGNLADVPYNLCKFFYKAVQVGHESKNKEFEVSQPDFDAMILSHPDEFNKMFRGFMDSINKFAPMFNLDDEKK